MGGSPRAHHQALDFLLQGGRGGDRRAERPRQPVAGVEFTVAQREQAVVACPERQQMLDRGPPLGVLAGLFHRRQGFGQPLGNTGESLPRRHQQLFRAEHRHFAQQPVELIGFGDDREGAAIGRKLVLRQRFEAVLERLGVLLAAGGLQAQGQIEQCLVGDRDKQLRELLLGAHESGGALRSVRDEGQAIVGGLVGVLQVAGQPVDLGHHMGFVTGRGDGQTADLLPHPLFGGGQKTHLLVEGLESVGIREPWSDRDRCGGGIRQIERDFHHRKSILDKFPHGMANLGNRPERHRGRAHRQHGGYRDGGVNARADARMHACSACFLCHPVPPEKACQLNVVTGLNLPSGPMTVR